MTGLDVSFTDDELAVIRSEAEREGVSLDDFVHDAAVAAALSRKAGRAPHAAAQVAELSEGLNRRLA